MAHSYGTSGAWKTVVGQLSQCYPRCPSPQALTERIAAEQDCGASWAEEAASEVDRHCQSLRSCIPSLEAAIAAATSATEQRIAASRTRLEAQARGLEQAWIPLRWINLLFRLPPIREQLKWHMQEPERESWKERQALQAAVQELEKLSRAPQAAAGKLVEARRRRLDRMKEVAASGEHAGAVSELRMAEILSGGLSDDWHVFHDVNVEKGSWSWDGKSHRRSAQIDHVAVGPGGVFAIKDKHWSAKFAESGRYYDPYEQIHWAGKFLHFLLSDHAGRKIKVRADAAEAGRKLRQGEAAL